MATVIIMPKQGQSVESCILTVLNKKKGERVVVGDILFSYETDKASFEEEAKMEGTVLEVFFTEGDEIPVLTNVMVIGNDGESVDEFRPDNDSSALAAKSATIEPEVATYGSAPSQLGIVAPIAAVNDKYTISPRAKALAVHYGIFPGVVKGSGPEGRIIEEDIRAVIDGSAPLTALAREMAFSGTLCSPARGRGLAGAVKASDLVVPETTTTNAGDDQSEIRPMTNMRKLIAKSMYNSLHNSAQLTHHLSADARRIIELRKKVKKVVDSGYPVNITLNDMICYAVVKALKQFPQVNSHCLGDKMRYFKSVNLALAVDTDRGLMVPVVKSADSMTIAQLATAFKNVAAACKKGSIDPDLLSAEAASFTVSNLGNYGCEVFTPVINLPQSAILGVNTILPRPKDIGGGVFAFVPHIGLSLTYDHRALDGGEATRFLKQVATEIENMDFEL